MSRANVEDVPFVVSFAARAGAVALMLAGCVKLCRSMWGEIAYERDWEYPGDSGRGGS